MYDIDTQELPRPHADFNGYLQILWRQRWIILLCLEVVIAVVIFFNEFSDPVYEAVATVICEEPKSNILPEIGQPALTRSTMINLIEQLKSRTLAEELAQALPEHIVRPFNALAPANGNHSQKDAVIRKIQESLSLKMVPGSDVLQIKVTANDPQVAKIIANTFVELIMDWNSRKRRNEISGTREFVEKQFVVFRDKLSLAEEALRTFKEANRMTALSDGSAEILSHMTEAEAKYNETKTERAALERRRRMIKEKKHELAPAFAVGSGPEIQQLKRRLLELETRHASLRTKGARPGQPEVISIKQELSRVKEQLIAQLENNATALSNPLSQIKSLLQESVALEVNLETHKAREQELKNILDEYGRHLQALPKQEVELARLIRERDVDEKIYSMLLEKREELRIAEASKFGQVQLIDAAQEPLAPIKPRKVKNLALGLFLGLSLGVGLALLLEALDTSLKSPKDVEERVNLPVLAAIPSICPNGNAHAIIGNRDAGRSYAGRLLSQLDAGSHAYEAYRALQTKFAMANSSTVLRSILMTSANAAEGKTLTAINMAQAFARNGITTLLVDCDLRRPMIHHIFGLNPEPGLSDILRNKMVPVEKAAIKWAIQASHDENLFVLPCGTLPSNPYEILDTQRMRDVLAEFKRRYDLVILDSPPLMTVTDPVILGGEVDGVCLVIKSGRTRQDTALRAKQLLENGQTNILGTILNDIDAKTVNGYKTGNYYIS